MQKTSQLSNCNTYEGYITKLLPHQIFVFGSNPEGRHGGGTARIALESFGAIYGQGRGIQGQSYGLVTKNLKEGYREENGEFYPTEGLQSVTPDQIKKNIQELYDYAKEKPALEFLIAYTAGGSNLNGYTAQEMAHMFYEVQPIPSNITFEKAFLEIMPN